MDLVFVHQAPRITTESTLEYECINQRVSECASVHNELFCSSVVNVVARWHRQGSCGVVYIVKSLPSSFKLLD